MRETLLRFSIKYDAIGLIYLIVLFLRIDLRFSRALVDSIMQKRDKISVFLINHGADVNYRNPIIYAAIRNNVKIATMLVVKGADVNAVSNANDETTGLTALHAAVENDSATMVRFLLDSGADPNVKNGLGTPLHIAICNENDLSAVILIEHGAGLDIANDIGGKTIHDLLNEYPRQMVINFIEKKQKEAELKNIVPMQYRASAKVNHKGSHIGY